MKIEIKKGDNTFKFTEPLANDLLEYRINFGELQEEVFKLRDEGKAISEKGTEENPLSDEDSAALTEITAKLNLLIARRDKLNFEFAVKNLVEVESKLFTLDEVQSFQVSMDLLRDVLEAFNMSLTMEKGEGKK